MVVAAPPSLLLFVNAGPQSIFFPLNDELFFFPF